MTPKIIVLDETEKSQSIEPRDIPHFTAPTPKPVLSEESRKKLDLRRVRRAKREAKEIGHGLFLHVSTDLQNRLKDLIMILRSAGVLKDGRAHRIIMKALIDGFLSAGKEDR